MRKVLRALGHACFWILGPWGLGCYYETVDIPPDRGSGPIACYYSGDTYFSGNLTVTGTVNEGVIDLLKGSWTICKLSPEERLEARTYCDVEFQKEATSGGE